jgi:hypothetical protein
MLFDQVTLSAAGDRRFAMHCRIALIAPLSLIAAPLAAQTDIGTIARGAYVCELPGDVRTAAGIAQPEAGFTIESASRYNSPQGGGTYLRRGDTVTFTSGPRNGESYTVIGRDFLRRIEANGQPGRLRCLRQAG